MCLVAIREELAKVIEKFQPDTCAIEAIIYVQSHATAIIMGAARGAALFAAGEAGLSLTEYAPRRVKQAVVGFGRASKEQMSLTLSQMLGLGNPLPFDQSDALGLALCHALTWQG